MAPLSTIRTTAQMFAARLAADKDATPYNIAERLGVSSGMIQYHLDFLKVHKDVQAEIEHERISNKLATVGMDCICFGNLRDSHDRELLRPDLQVAIMQRLFAGENQGERAP